MTNCNHIKKILITLLSFLFAIVFASTLIVSFYIAQTLIEDKEIWASSVWIEKIYKIFFAIGLCVLSALQCLFLSFDQVYSNLRIHISFEYLTKGILLVLFVLGAVCGIKKYFSEDVEFKEIKRLWLFVISVFLWFILGFIISIAGFGV